MEGFAGSAVYASEVDGSAPNFFGDLLPYVSAFGSAPFSITATDLTIVGSALVPFDYRDFYDTGLVTIGFDGESSLAVTGVPLPPGLLLLLSSAAPFLILRRRSSRRAARGLCDGIPAAACEPAG